MDRSAVSRSSVATAATTGGRRAPRRLDPRPLATADPPCREPHASVLALRYRFLIRTQTMRAYFATGLDPKTLLVAEGNLTGMAYVELPTTTGTTFAAIAPAESLRSCDADVTLIDRRNQPLLNQVATDP